MLGAAFDRFKAISFFTFLFCYHPHFVLAGAQEILIKGNENLVLQVHDAVIKITGNSALKSLKINLLDGAQDEYEVLKSETSIQVRSRTQGVGVKDPKKLPVLEIQGPSLPIEIFGMQGQVQIQKWSKEVFVRLQKGKVLLKEVTAGARAHLLSGDLSVLEGQGKYEIDVNKASVLMKGHQGDVEIQSFSGDIHIDGHRGSLSLATGTGSGKVLNSQGSVQFENQKGVLNIQQFKGRIDGQLIEGSVHLTMALDSEVNVKAQSGKVQVTTQSQAGTYLNLHTSEGELYLPGNLKVVRDGSQKFYRGRLKGEAQRGSVIVKSVDGAIVVR